MVLERWILSGGAVLVLLVAIGCEQAVPAAATAVSETRPASAEGAQEAGAEMRPPPSEREYGGDLSAQALARAEDEIVEGYVEADPEVVRRLKELRETGTVSDLVEKVDLPSHDADGTPIITFEQLAAYRYPRFLEPGEAPPTEEDIPEAIRALDGATVIVSGYMMPTKLRNGKVEKFMLVPNTLACCYGKPLELNEWVNVDMTGKAADAVPDVRIAVRGVLRVGENKIDGWVMDLYRMDADRVRIQDGF